MRPNQPKRSMLATGIWVVLMSTMPDHTGGTVAAGLLSAQKASVPPVLISTGVQTDSLGNLSKITALPPPQTQPPTNGISWVSLLKSR